MSEFSTLYFSLKNMAPPPKGSLKNLLKKASTEPVTVPLTPKQIEGAETLLREQGGLELEPHQILGGNHKDVVIIGGKIKDTEGMDGDTFIAKRKGLVKLLEEKLGPMVDITGAKAKGILEMMLNL